MNGENQHWDDGTFGAKLHELHRAGGDWFPDLATEIASSVRQVHGVTRLIAIVSSEAQHPAALRGLLELRTALHMHLIKTVESMAATGAALTAIAEDYLAVDERARDDYERIQQRVRFEPRVAQSADTLPRPGDPRPGQGATDYY